MRPILAYGPNHYASKIHPALRSFADECCGVLARLIAYVGALALIAIVGLSLWDEFPLKGSGDPTAKSAWSNAARSYPAFAVSQFDLSGKTETYEILQHPEGGLVVPGRRTAVPARRHRLYSEPADPADGWK